VKKYLAGMAKARRAYFGSHHSRKARRAFVKRQQAKLAALRRAAACEVPVAGAVVVESIPIPGSGGIGVGLGRVWALDREAHDLYRIEPAAVPTGSDVSHSELLPLTGAVGGAAPVVGKGAVWIADGLGNKLLRVDAAAAHALNPPAVTHISTGPTSDEMPITAVVAAGSVWVGNHHGGTVARIDPKTNTVVATIPWGAHGGGGIYHMTTDGSHIWVTGSRTSDVAEIDTSTNSIVRRTPVPTGTCGGLAVDASAVWITSGFDAPYTCWWSRPDLGVDRIGVSRIDRATGAVTRIDVGGRPIDVRSAFGSIWILVDAPRLELVRLDPATYHVIGRLRLSDATCDTKKTPYCPGAELGSALEVGFDSLWVRRAAAATVPGALLRIVPS